MTSFVRFSESAEVPEKKESETISDLKKSFDHSNLVTCDHYRHAVRGAHAKCHGVLTGTLEVLPDLPLEYRQGLFAQPRSFEVIARLSTAPGDILPDSVSTARGFALKILGVDGKMLSTHAGSTTQDFLFASGLSFPVGDIASFLQQQKLLEETVDSLVRSKELVSLAARAANATLGAVGLSTPKLGLVGYPTKHILSDEYGTQAPLRFGDFIAKLALRPASAALKELGGRNHAVHENFSALQKDVESFFRESEGVFELCAQLCVDLEKMPVEDASVEWPQDLSPYVPLATLRFPRQETFSPRKRVFADDALSFNPWHALEAHRPLGRIMRARRVVYESSANFRMAQNARDHVEPKSLAEIPD